MKQPESRQESQPESLRMKLLPPYRDGFRHSRSKPCFHSRLWEFMA